MLEDINPGPGSSANQLFLFADVNGLCYFDAYDPNHGNELWQSDGTTAGTVLVQDIYPGSQGSVPTDLTSFNNKLYFFATDPDHGRELWDPPPVGNPVNPGNAAGPLVEISNPDPLPSAPPGFSGTNFGAEPYVAVNPTNPKNIVAAWMDHPFNANAASVTFNGGATSPSFTSHLPLEGALRRAETEAVDQLIATLDAQLSLALFAAEPALVGGSLAGRMPAHRRG
jgi:ELWxxDGT repeat protein